MPIDPKNRLNDLDSRQWLQFQKSWFLDSNDTVHAFIRFFTKQKNSDDHASRVGILPEQTDRLSSLIRASGRSPLPVERSAADGTADYVLIDWRDEKDTLQSYRDHGPARLAKVYAAARVLRLNGYLTILMRNATSAATLLPFAWHFSRLVTRFLSAKDEKIGCEAQAPPTASNGWQTAQNCFYCLIFRKDEEIAQPAPAFMPLEISHLADADREQAVNRRSAWDVVKPPPREKGVLLHPAKFPESLITQFIEDFSRPGELVFDPMAGTGSALLAAHRAGRRSAGIELNAAFVRIIQQRVQQEDLFNQSSLTALVCGDATQKESYENVPRMIDYVVTSPPYWDMLRMKGAETQKKRRDAGLPVFYSEGANDLGNLEDYNQFIEMLLRAYRLVIDRLKPGGFMTVIVKNVKKRGRIYPLAWDIAFALAPYLELRHEQFWCQDDQKLAPFGYRYAWVSNTFHHYCLHFRKPLS